MAESEAPQKKTIRVVAAVIQDGDRYLITQRRPSAVLPMMWEFPGGRVEVGETDRTALKREVSHRLGVEISFGKLMSYVSHEYERYSVGLHLYECHLAEGQPAAVNVHAFAWVKSADFERYLFTPADEASVTALLGL
jgi:8-oxo-dGTP diphosphatase